MDSILETLVTLNVHMGNEDSAAILERNSKVEHVFISLETLLTKTHHGHCTKKLNRMYVRRVDYIFHEIAPVAPRRALLVLMYLIKTLVMIAKHSSSIDTAKIFHVLVMNISGQTCLDLQNKSFISDGLNDREKQFVSSVCNSSVTIHNAHVISSMYDFFLHSLCPLEIVRTFNNTLTMFTNMEKGVSYPYLLTAGHQIDPLGKDITSTSKYKHLLLQLISFGVQITWSSLVDALEVLMNAVMTGLQTAALISAITSIVAHADLSIETIVQTYYKLLDNAIQYIDRRASSQNIDENSYLNANHEAIVNSVMYILIHRYQLFLNSNNLLPSSDLIYKLSLIFDRDSCENCTRKVLNPILNCYFSIIFDAYFQGKDDRDAIVQRLGEIKSDEFKEYMQALDLNHIMLPTGIKLNCYRRQYDIVFPSSMPGFSQASTVDALIKHYKRATFSNMPRKRTKATLENTNIILNMDVWSLIISYCNIIVLCRLQCVSKDFNKCVTPEIWRNIFLKRFPKCFFQRLGNDSKNGDSSSYSAECVSCFGGEDPTKKIKEKVICCVSPNEKHNWKKLLKDRLVASRSILGSINYKLCPIIGCLKILKSKKSYDRHLSQMHDIHS